MAIILCVLLFTALMIVISYYGYRRYARPARVYEQLGAPVLSAESTYPSLSGTIDHGLAVNVIRQIGEKVPVSPQGATMMRRYLIAAGYRSDSALPTYLGIKVVLCVVMVLLALTFRGYLVDNAVLRMVLTVGAGFAGFYIPTLVLERMVVRRQEAIRLSLPDALDLLVVSVEAGVALDQAINNVSRELAITHKDICDEFELVTLEMRAGKRRGDALHNLAERTGEPELRKLVAVLIQTDRFGTSMAESLRTHSDYLRVRRRQEAEERANKVGVKLVFPIFFLILPSMLIVAAGAGILQIVKYLFPMMRQFHG